MIDGLKLTMTGEELRKRLDQRVKEHERRAAWYKREAKRDPDPNSVLIYNHESISNTG